MLEAGLFLSDWLTKPTPCHLQPHIRFDPSKGQALRDFIAAVEDAGFEAHLWRGAVTGAWLMMLIML
jgi:hypothetical protein